MDTYVCPKCEGKGKVLMAFRQNGYDLEEYPCTVCKGSGKASNANIQKQAA